MKKVFCLLALVAASFTQAQISVTKLDGTPISNGQLFGFNSLDYDVAYFGFLVHNNTTAPLNVRISCENVINGTGAGMELCFGDVCLASVSPGHSYPSNAVTIQPGGTNSQFDHFLATQAGTGTPTDYIFKFYVEGEFGPEGETVTVTYRYDPNLATNSFGNAFKGAELKSSVVSQNLEVRAAQAIALEVYDANGKSVRRQQLVSGDNTVDVSSLAPGVYVAYFSNGVQKSSAKFVKQ